MITKQVIVLLKSWEEVLLINYQKTLLTLTNVIRVLVLDFGSLSQKTEKMLLELERVMKN